jgi:hypothetical protein
MSIPVQCGKCGGRFTAKDAHRGMAAHCPTCGQPLVIPLVAKGDSGVAEIGDLVDQWAPADREAALAHEMPDINESTSAPVVHADPNGKHSLASVAEDAPPCPACKHPLGANAAHCVYCELSTHAPLGQHAAPSHELPKDRNQFKRCKMCKRKSRYATTRPDGLCRDCAKKSGEEIDESESKHHHGHDVQAEQVNLWMFIVPLGLAGVALLVMSLHGMIVRLQGPTPPAQHADAYAYMPGEPIREDNKEYLVKEAPSVVLAINMGERTGVTNSSDQICWGYEEAEVTLDGGPPIVPDVNGTRGAWWGFRVNPQGAKPFSPRLSLPLGDLSAEPVNVSARLNIVYAVSGWSGSKFTDKNETLERHFRIVRVSEKDFDKVARYREILKEYEGRGWRGDVLLLLLGLPLIAASVAWGVYVVRRDAN